LEREAENKFNQDANRLSGFSALLPRRCNATSAELALITNEIRVAIKITRGDEA
jgi:hypothetical protein